MVGKSGCSDRRAAPLLSVSEAAAPESKGWTHGLGSEPAERGGTLCQGQVGRAEERESEFCICCRSVGLSFLIHKMGWWRKMVSMTFKPAHMLSPPHPGPVEDI